MLPIPKKLVKQGVRDMVRLSDARMSGTSYGACILHVSPESYIGGPLALVRTGDMISLDVAERTIDLNVPDEELAAPPRRLEEARAALRARLRLDVHAPHQAGQRGLRLRLPRNRLRRARRRAGDLLIVGQRPAMIDPEASDDPRQAEDRQHRHASPPRCSSAAFATSSSRTCIRCRPSAGHGRARPSRCATCRRART